MTLRRRLVRALPATLLTLAIAAYGALLFKAHAASKQADPRPSYVQLFGSDATKRGNALDNPDSGALAIGDGVQRNSFAQWRFRPHRKSAPGVVIRDVRLFVAGTGLAFYRRNGYAKISLDGKRIALLKPLRPKGAKAGDGPFQVGNAAPRAIDLPGDELGFGFSLPARGACITSGCTLRIDLVRATWTVGRVGVLFSARTPAAVLWPPNGGEWIVICLAAAALAALSHCVLSLRARTYRAPDTEWKAT